MRPDTSQTQPFLTGSKPRSAGSEKFIQPNAEPPSNGSQRGERRVSSGLFDQLNMLAVERSSGSERFLCQFKIVAKLPNTASQQLSAFRRSR